MSRRQTAQKISAAMQIGESSEEGVEVGLCRMSKSRCWRE